MIFRARKTNAHPAHADDVWNLVDHKASFHLSARKDVRCFISRIPVRVVYNIVFILITLTAR